MLKRLLTVVCSVLLLDQASKAAVLLLMRRGESIPVVSDFVRLTLVQNSGAAFGMLSGRNLPLVLTTLLAAAAVAFLILRSRRRGSPFSFPLTLVLGGALGNLADRVRLGEVVDFIDVGWRLHRWPVFNVADIAITAGVVLFCYYSIFNRKA
jgi:signal peptidase II